MTNPSDPREYYARALAQTGSIVAAVRLEHLGNPTPCTEYDVRALLSHIVAGVRRAAVLGEGGDSMATSVWADGVSDDGWPAAYRAVGDRALAAWADGAMLDEMVTTAWGTVPGRGALSGYTMEALMHGWDLAISTGQQPELDPELAVWALGVAKRILPPEPRGGKIPFGPVVPVDADAEVYAQLAGWLGRRNRQPGELV